MDGFQKASSRNPGRPAIRNKMPSLARKRIAVERLTEKMQSTVNLLAIDQQSAIVRLDHGPRRNFVNRDRWPHFDDVYAAIFRYRAPDNRNNAATGTSPAKTASVLRPAKLMTCFIRAP